MATSLDTHCGVCGAVASRITLLAPGEKPEGHGNWDETLRAVWEENYAAGGRRVVYDGLAAGSGTLGNEVSEAKAQRYRDILHPPRSVERIGELELLDDASVCPVTDAHGSPDEARARGSDAANVLCIGRRASEVAA